MKRVVTYIHHATEGDWETWEPQMLHDYAKEHSGAHVESHVEIGYVGRDRRRPNLEMILTACESGKYSEVFVLRQSHLSRNTLESIKIYDRLKKCGVRLTIMQLGTSEEVDKTIELIKAVGYGA